MTGQNPTENQPTDTTPTDTTPTDTTPTDTTPTDTTPTDREKYEFILGVYFRTQAAIEKYVGDRLPEWTAHVAKMNADSARKRLSDRVDQERSVLGGLSSMLAIYGSDQTFTEQDGAYWLEVRRCGIYDYRERAREQGVELTLAKPCEFCVPLHHNQAANLEMAVAHELGERSCRWVCHRPENPTPPLSAPQAGRAA
jgi:hypothetical protein